MTLLRVGDEARAPRRLRLRADQRLSERLGPPEAANEVARLRIPCREAVEEGDRIFVEISFGAMVDEVELEGRVTATVPGSSGAPPTIVVAFDHCAGAQIAYLQGVLGGQRSPSARAHRRIPVDARVKWRSGELRQSTRAHDLSRGGAFILSHIHPVVGSLVEVELVGEGASLPLRLAAVVTWIQRSGSAVGFGVRFQVRTREEGDHLHRMVRLFEGNTGVLTDR